MNKTQKVKEHLIKYGKITSWEAITRYRATRLSSIIYNLRYKYGMNIITVNNVKKDEDGETIQYATYCYEKENNNAI